MMARPELDLLLACARQRPASADGNQLTSLLRKDLDWHRLLRLADWHRLLPLLYWHLQFESSPEIPAMVRTELQAAFARNAAQSLALTAELLAIIRLLEAEDIPALPYKGPALAAQVYGNLALRSCGDLDILVLRTDVLRVRELLLSRGYRPRHEVTSTAAAFMLTHRYSEILERADGVTVELHWAFTNGDVAFPLDLGELLPRLRRMRLGGGSVLAFSPEDLLLVLCVHGAKHRWSRLEWLCGVALLLHSSPALDWPLLMARARTHRAARRVGLGLLLAHDTLGAPVPETLLSGIRRDRRLTMLAAEVRTDLLECNGRVSGFERAASLPHDVFQLRVSDGAVERMRLLVYRATTPSEPVEWHVVSLGDVVVPVHLLLRPFRLASRLLPALWWHLRHERSL